MHVVQRFLRNLSRSRTVYRRTQCDGLHRIRSKVSVNMILDGEVDDLPEQAFLNVGTIEEAIEKVETITQTGEEIMHECADMPMYVGCAQLIIQFMNGRLTNWHIGISALLAHY